MAELRPPGSTPRVREPKSPDDPVLDGRHRRSQRSRERILDAVARAITDPDTVLTPERIAARAGVSISTISRHFGDMEGLATAMRERVAGKAIPYFMAGPFVGDTQTRLRELLRRRAAIFEIVGPFQRASLRQPWHSRGDQERRTRFATALRAQMTAALEPELRDDAEAAQIVGALLSLGTWAHLRLEQGLGVDAAAALVERAVLAQLEARTAQR